MALFGWLAQTPPEGGLQRRWRDLIHLDLKAVGVPEEEWYEAAYHNVGWPNTYSSALKHQLCQQSRLAQTQDRVQCLECRRCFHREADTARHKCTAEWQKPVSEQCGAVQCFTHSHWFQCHGGLPTRSCCNELWIKLYSQCYSFWSTPPQTIVGPPPEPVAALATDSMEVSLAELAVATPAE